jgi:magnesium-transporting ATPase (P-type)
MSASSRAETKALTVPAASGTVNAPWHALRADEVLRCFRVRPTHGLSRHQEQAQRRQHGPNALPEPPPRPAWRLFARQFASPLIYILFAAAMLAVGLGHYGDAAVILAVVLANALIGGFQEGRAERSMAALRHLAAVHVRVVREGREAMVEARALVPGDVVLLAAGDAVAADARLLEEAQLQVAEAALTGESVPVSKAPAPLPDATGLADRRNMIYSGTYITAGRGRAVVVATGTHTEVGRIAGLTQGAIEPQTPLQQRIGQFGRALVAAALALFILIVLLGLWRDLPLSEVLMVAVSQMVSMVPEGLPVAMTIALAIGMQRMAARGVIIRRLSAVETLGSTTVICSDKTGTLTRNEMTVTALWLPASGSLGARRIEVKGTGYSPEGELTENGAPADLRASALACLLEAGALCNDAQLRAPSANFDGWRVVGDPTEGALLVLAAKAGIDLRALNARSPRDAELPFDADAKLMATRHRLDGAARRVIIKGAPEAVLRLCGGVSEEIRLAHAAADEMAAQAWRVLAFAQVDDDPLDPAAGFGALAGRARLIGLAGQIDPPRDEAKVAVADCRAAGIRPVMVTGDHKLTGLAIARALGIAREGDRAVDGVELESMGEAELREELPDIAVFARVQPAQKLRIVEALQARGEVVAMTGDGVNDAPALARADVGVAMGITGTEVAKSAARIVITDDNFATIVRAVEQGRVVYGNLKKVILYLFATSIDEVALLLLALFAGYGLPLAAVQILWINIVTEGTLTVNLVMEPAEGDEMRRKPVPRDDALVDSAMLRRVALMALTAVTVTFGWFAWRMGTGVEIAQARTETFTLLAMCQWFNVLNCQSATSSALRLGLLRNPWLLAGLSASVLLQLAVLFVPAMNTLFHTVPLPASVLLALAALASSVLWAEELRKLAGRARVGKVAAEANPA